MTKACGLGQLGWGAGRGFKLGCRGEMDIELLYEVTLPAYGLQVTLPGYWLQVTLPAYWLQVTLKQAVP